MQEYTGQIDSDFFAQAKPLFDSRKLLLVPQEYIFFAFTTAHRDGHDFIPELYQKGVRRFVVNTDKKNYFQQFYPEAKFLATTSPLALLQAWAKLHRMQHNDLEILAITGSNGKTIVKEWLYQLIIGESAIIKNPKSYNSQIGVPISLLNIEKEHRIGVFEAGISKVGEMQILAHMIQANVGLFTNIGIAHSEGFKDDKEKIREKALLFEHCHTIYFNGNQPMIGEVLSDLYSDKKLVAILIQKETNAILPFQKKYKASNIETILITLEKLNNKSQFSFLWKGNSILGNLNFSDTTSIENSLQALILALHFGIDYSILKAKLLSLANINMRLEQKQGANQTQIIDDTYSNDPIAMNIALDFLKSQAKYDKKTIIFSPFAYGKSKDYQLLAKAFNSANINTIVAIGADLQDYKEIFLSAVKQAYFFDNATDLIKAIQNEIIVFQKESILVKGARDFKLEEIIQQLQAQKHDTVLSISLPALRHNYQVFKSMLKPNTKTMAMVKAFAYGSGSTDVAHRLVAQGVDYLGVAYADEGIELRKNGIQTPIFVMNVNSQSFGALAEFKLEPAIGSWKNLKAFAEFAAQSNTALGIHLEVDTGMRRLGFHPLEDIQTLIEFFNENKHLKLLSIFSHLAAAEDKMQDDYTIWQIETFRNFTNDFKNGTETKPLCHILNTAGATRWTKLGEFDMVRLGIGLHGIDGTNGLLSDVLHPVAELKTTISQIRTLLPHETIGYGRLGKTEKPTRIATIAIGYADGFLRYAGKGNVQVWINGFLCPTIGNICMDMAFIDLGDCPAQEGDTVVIFGNHHRIETMAKQMNTIPYELLTNVGMRIPRVFYED